MPFQVIFSVYNEPQGKIFHISAGEDVVVMCSPLVTLQAIIIGDTEGHTFLWEQITGSAVTFTGPTNQLMVQYVPTTFDDKTFRFWVDKGTGTEQFDDVIMFGTPTSTVDVSNITGSPYNANIVEYGDRTPELRALFNFPENVQDAIASTTIYTNPALNWTIPPIDTLIQFVLYEKILGVWTTIVTLPSTINTYFNVNIESIYKIVAEYQDYNKLSSFDSNIVYFPSEILTVTEHNLITIANTTKSVPSTYHDSIAVLTYEVDNFILAPFPPVIDSMDVISTKIGFDFNMINISYEVDDFILASFPPVIDSMDVISTKVGFDFSMINISYEVDDLTGGGIGG